MAKIVKEGSMYIPNEIEENTCIHCGTVAEVNFDEAFMGEYGLYFYVCPKCGKITPLEADLYVNKDELTIDNITYPVHFHTVIEEDMDISDGEISTIIRDRLKNLRESGNEIDWSINGDTMIFIFKDMDEEEYHVFVGKNFEHTIVEFQGDDYFGGSESEE